MLYVAPPAGNASFHTRQNTRKFGQIAARLFRAERAALEANRRFLALQRRLGCNVSLRTFDKISCAHF